MKKVSLHIHNITNSVSHTHSYAVVLAEDNGPRKLPVVIGGYEAQAIAVALEGITPPRPLSHDLMRNLLDSFEIKLQEIIINDLQEGVFYALLVCERDGEIIEIDSRTSDAIALAVRFNCPIYAYSFIMETAGIIFDDEGTEVVQENDSDDITDADVINDQQEPEYANLSIDDLNKTLEEAIQNEDYLKAAEVRDEISRRGK